MKRSATLRERRERRLIRALAALFTVLLPVVPSCGGPKQHQRTSAGAFVHYRSPALPAGSTVLPDSFGGIRNPHEIVLNPTNGRIYICGRIGDLGVLILDATTDQKVGMIRERDAGAIQYNPVTNTLYISAGRGRTGEFLVVDCATDSIVDRDTWGLWPLCVNLTDNKLYAALYEGRDVKVAVLDGRTRRMLGKVRVGPFVKWGLDRILWNPTSNTLYCNDENSGAIVVIDGRTNREVTRIRHRHSLSPGCVNTKNNKIYASSWATRDSSVAVIDCRTNRIVAWLAVGNSVKEMAHNPTENKVYCSAGWGPGGNVSGVVVIDGASDCVIARLTTPGEPEGLVYDSVNNRVFCFGYAEGWVAAIDCRSDSIIGVARAGENMYPAVFYPPANRLYCMDWKQGDVYVVDCASFAVVDTFTLGYRVESMLYNRNKDKLYCANDMGHSLAVIDGADGRVLSTVEVGREPGALACSKDGSRLYCANERDGTVSVIDCNSDKVTATVRVGHSPSALCLSPATNRLFCANRGSYYRIFDSTVSVIDCRNNTVVATLTVGREPSDFAYDSVHGRIFCTSSAGRVGQDDPEMRVDAFVAADLSRVLSVCFPGWPRDLCYDAVHDRLYVVHSNPDKVTAVDCRTGVVTAHFWAGGSPELMCYNPRRHKLYCASPDLVGGKGTEGNDDTKFRGRGSEVGGGRTVAVVHTDGDSSVARISVPGGPRALCYVPETDRIYCACARDTVVVIDCATDRVLDHKAVGAGPAALEYSSRHGVVFVANSRGSSISYIRDGSASEPRR